MKQLWLPLLGLALGMVTPGVAHGQTRDGEGWSSCAGLGVGSAVVRIRLIPEAAGLDLSRGIRLVRGQTEGCGGLTTEEGTFEFRGVPPGSYELSFGWLGLQPVEPLTLEVRDELVVSIEIPARAENIIEECLYKERCLSVLTRQTSVEITGSEDQRLEFLAYRVLIAMVRESWDETDWVICIDGPEERVRTLREVYPNVVASTECERRERTPRQPLLEHIATGRPASHITLGFSGPRPDDAPPGRGGGLVERTSPTSALIRGFVGRGPRYGRAIECEAELRGASWVVRRCRTTGNA